MLAMRVLADEKKVRELVDKLARQVAADLGGPEAGPWALIGIRSRGDVLAQRLAQKLQPDHVGVLDITLYRDDLSELADQPVVRTTEIPFALDGLNVVLVDDVLMTGRSIRAALQLLMDLGRPKRVWLAVLVDRGGRELPIAPDHVALDLSGRNPKSKAASEVQPGQRVEVRLIPMDEQDAVVIREPHADTSGSAIPPSADQGTSVP